MRWKVKPKRKWKPWFAILPMRGPDGEMIWMEPIWVCWQGDYSVWVPWDRYPNDDAP